MAIQTLSNCLLALYEGAEQQDPPEFLNNAVSIIGKLIDFDGAILGSSRADPVHRNGMIIESAHVHNRDESMLAEYAAISRADPIAEELIQGLRAPVVHDLPSYYGDRRLADLEDFSMRYDLQKLLLFGNRSPAKNETQWLALFRREDTDFTHQDAEFLSAAWPHLSKTLRLNMEHALQKIDPQSHSRALALVNSRGMIEIANQAMQELLKIEWPGFQARNLSLSVMTGLIGTGKYRGRAIEISASQRFGYMACTARRIPDIEMLAPSELSVADRFAKGMTHSEIASNLKVSPHTVRNQIAHVYQKLGIHSKVDLVRMMANRQI